MMLSSPLAQKQWRRFKSIKRGYFSAVFLLALLLFSCFAELFVNNRAIVVSYQGRLFFPTYGSFLPGTTFGLDYAYETNFRELAQRLSETGEGWVLMPPVPFSAFENDLHESAYPPYPPSFSGA